MMVSRETGGAFATAVRAEQPLISVIILSLNQAQYLEESLLSVLNQTYPRVEAIVIDGGSKDGSVDIIKKYAHRLAYWVSEPDTMPEAYVKGLAHCTGELMTIHSSDDKHFPWAYDIVAEVFSLFPEIEWLTSVSHIGYDQRGRAVFCYHWDPGYNRKAFFRGRNAGIRGFHFQWVQTSASFWRRPLWDKAEVSQAIMGRRAVDFAIWAAMIKVAEPYATRAILGGERFHPHQSVQNPEWIEKYRIDAAQQLKEAGGRLPGPFEIICRKILRRIPKAPRLLGWPCNTVEYDVYEQRWKIGKAYFI